jgi:hypothetical protein
LLTRMAPSLSAPLTPARSSWCRRTCRLSRTRSRRRRPRKTLSASNSYFAPASPVFCPARLRRRRPRSTCGCERRAGVVADDTGSPSPRTTRHLQRRHYCPLRLL